jgi:hypothetical protein
MIKNNKITIAGQKETPLSKEQKQFNRLNSQILKEKELLLNWQNKITEFKIIYARELAPLQDLHDKSRAQIVYLFDEIYDDKSFTKTERKKMLYIIEEIAQGLAADDEKIKAIYNKRGSNNFDEEQAFMNENAINYMKSAVSKDFDINLDDIELNKPEDFIKEFEKQMQEKISAAEELNKPNRKKSAKAREKEAKIAKETQEVSQSIKEIYRQLAKTLHPDREADPDERVRKTELMQKINIAYNKNDLLTLLQMQLELEQIDQDSINSIGIEKVKHYNTVLKKQLQEIKQEIFFTCDRFQMEFDIPMFEIMPYPDWIVSQLKKDIKEMTREVKQIQKDLEGWRSFSVLKEHLKEFKIPNRNPSNIPLWMES